MSAVDLARLRALGTGPLAADTGAVVQAAAAVGRSPRRAGSRVVLGRHPEAPAAADLGATPATLSPSALVALGLCVGLAWTEREEHPYPGEPVTLDEVLTAARELGIGTSASRHIVGAIRHVLAQAHLLEVDHDTIRLGPAVAAWSDADLEAFRRNPDVLPVRPEEDG